MAEMRFLLELKEFLKKNSRIYTVRKYRYNPTSGLVLVIGVGKCSRTLVKEGVTKKDLDAYYHESGFETVDDWWAKIVHFIPGMDTKYLYKVEVLSGT